MDNDNVMFVLIAIVAIVAIVGMVVLFTAQQPAQPAPRPEAQVYPDANQVGEAMLRDPQDASDKSGSGLK